VSLAEFLATRGEELISFRRDLHAHPELSEQETRTTAAVVRRLQVAGLEPKVLNCGTGLICDVGTGDGPVLALRADIDALAMADECDTPYRSHIEGVAHACGHDVHTAIVLGAGLYFASNSPGGRVRLIFEPAEESVPGGAIDVIDEGHLEDVGVIFGLHCDPKKHVGHIGLRTGPVSSASDVVRVTLHGPGGHTARPEATVDLVTVMSELALRLPQVLTERVEHADKGPIRLVWGAVASGDAANVIPAKAVLTGTLRTPDRVVWEALGRLLDESVEQILGDSGVQWELYHRQGVPPVENHVEPTALWADAIAEEFGQEAVVPTEQSWGGDSFAWYVDRVPGCYARLGVHNGNGETHDLHASTFDVDERAIAVGVRAMVAATRAWFSRQP
jgi:amidohydrolase